MQQWRGWGLVCATVVVMGAGCGDDGSPATEPDASPDTGGDTTADTTPDVVTPPSECWPARSGTNFALEPASAEQEWADCVAGCDHDLPVYELDTATFSGDGLAGRIDAESHGFPSVTDGPDIDLVAIFAEPRTMVEILVEPADEDSLFDPVIQTRDGVRGTMTFSAGVVDGFRGARTVVAAPLIEIPFYLVVEDAVNYDALRPAGGGLPDSDDFVGGDDYDYIVRVRTSPFDPTDLGELSDTQPLSLESAEIVCGGDTHYYTFTIDGGGTPLIEVESTGSSDLVLVVAGLNGTGGRQLAWDTVLVDGEDDDTDGSVTLDGVDIAPGGGNYIFAVTDFNGLAGPGEFTYSIDVTLQ